MNKNKNEEKLIGDIKKKYRDDMSDEQKQKQRDYQIDYRKKYYAAKKLNNNDNKIIDNKIIDDKIINDNDSDFYCISIIIKLKINKKVCSQVYLEECNFINNSYNKNG